MSNILARCITEGAQIDLPHVMITCVDGTPVAYSGPFADGLSALAAAEREHREWAALEESDDVTFHVAALYPADPRQETAA